MLVRSLQRRITCSVPRSRFLFEFKKLTNRHLVAKSTQIRFFYGNTDVTKPTPMQKLVDSAPPQILPYLKLLRMHLPIGSYLLFWPCAWSLTLAADPGTLPNVPYLLLFGCGAVLMRGAGCIVNDMWDRKIDRLVERTRVRPLASGEISMKKATALLASQLLLGLCVLLQFNWYSVALGICSLPFVILYPTAKKFFNYPQLILGLTFNWGALMGWAVIHGSLDLAVVLPVYIAGIAWTLHYDTIYAHQDKADDVLVGIKSTALTFGDENTKKYLLAFSSVTSSLLTSVGYHQGLGEIFYVGMGLTFLHLMWQIKTLDIHNPSDCGSKFRANKWTGLLIWVSFLLGKLTQ